MAAEEMMMDFFGWMDSRMKILGWKDMALVKISVMGFTLMIAKLYAPVLRLRWYWYALIFVATAIPPMLKIFRPR
ncbi:hypothetical protein J2T58_001739 [Methanocalculus alkaliphilus]|uniref:hypothetical protein n=1 Tax=Methanocalculus alkaliphilus TaxID=768730 RepID=UPI0020A161EC|nr:hypothetical protein [Methanocalculus alkaliphilus]MCP1715868.1 hypothetical protein [Methanocalculus alkaliphilus]